jgi:hypothetical protein
LWGAGESAKTLLSAAKAGTPISAAIGAKAKEMDRNDMVQTFFPGRNEGLRIVNI